MLGMLEKNKVMRFDYKRIYMEIILSEMSQMERNR